MMSLLTAWLTMAAIGLSLVHLGSTQSGMSCGDGFLDIGELCDDNNTVALDGCSDTCQIEFGFACTGTPSVCTSTCGDGLVATDEMCDDNNTLSGDGCTDNCSEELGYDCTGSSPSVCMSVCGDGIRIDSEQCDDGMDSNTTGDGCTECQIENNFVCMENLSGLSMCDAVLLDLNVPDTTTLGYTSEYFDLDEVVYLFDQNNTNMSSFFVSPLGGDWTALFVLILNGVEAIDNQVDIFPVEAQAAGRIPSVTAAFLDRSVVVMGDTRLDGFAINSSDVVAGMLITGDASHPFGDGDELLSSNEIYIALQSIGYIARAHPGFGPREFCLIADDAMYNTIACVTLYFIGRNDDRPEINYTPNSIVQFVEGQMDFVRVVDGLLLVTDEDHPTRYPLQSAQVSIAGFNSGYPEQLSVTSEQPGFVYAYDESTGILTIVGNGTADVYSSILSTITYYNNMTEPLGSSRTLRLTVNDGIGESNALDITVAIVNVNDAPLISLDGRDPIVMNQSVTYMEGRGDFSVAPRLFVIDTDPGAMIQWVTVTLTNPIDTNFESLDLTANLTGTSLSLSNTSHRLELSGLATQEVYSTILRTLAYRHDDAMPGNPTVSPSRLIEFYIQDDKNASNVVSSTLYVVIQPVNDPPVLLLDPPPTANFSYLEDDLPVNIGQDLSLRDVDTNISSTTIYITGLLDGAQDRVYLIPSYGIIVNETETSGGNRTITLNGEATPSQYEEVLRSLSYRNLYMNNSVTDGRRTVAIVTRDSLGLDSGRVYIHIDVMDRNDGPKIDIGQGVNMDDTITFIENGASVPIVTSFLTSVMDEEAHNISRLTLQLISPNGKLDENDAIFFRTPGGLQFLSSLDTPLTTTYISISLNATPQVYEEALKSIYYDNSELEPTFYNSTTGTDRLMRMILISITDTNFIDPNTNAVDAANADMGVSTTMIRIGVVITPINDNRPQILIDSDPESCSIDSRDSSDLEVASSRRRRDVRSVSRIRKKSVVLSSIDVIDSMAPKLISACPTFTNTSLPSTKCLKQLVLTFNTNTNSPVVEVPSKLDNLISFDPPELNSAHKFGLWLDYTTLVVHFVGCTEVEIETTSGKPRPMFVAFEAERGECDWSTLCTSGVCYHNNSGCPVVSYTRISNDPNSCGTKEVVVDQPSVTPDRDSNNSFGSLVLMFIVSSLILISLILLIKYIIVIRRSRPSNTTKQVIETPDNSVTIQIPPQQEGHVQELIKISSSSEQTLKDEPIEPLPQYTDTPTTSPSKGDKDKPSVRSPDAQNGRRRSPKSKPSSEVRPRVVQPKAKRKTLLPQEESLPEEVEAVEEVPSSYDRLQGVATSLSCDQSHDHQRGTVTNSNRAVSPQGEREQSIDNSHRGTNWTAANNKHTISKDTDKA